MDNKPIDICPVGDCQNKLEHDAIFCGDCFVLTKQSLYKFLIRMRSAARRTKKPKEQQELQERYEANLRGICRQVDACRTIKREKRHA